MLFPVQTIISGVNNLRCDQEVDTDDKCFINYFSLVYYYKL